MCTDQTFTTHGEEVVLAVSLELAAAKWKVALHDGQRERPAVHTVAQPQATARLQAVLALIDAHRDSISEASVRRIWQAHGLKPHRLESFKVSNDKHFAEKLED